uniref:IsdH protein n=1 Tax=Fopius arisanus TaxID=64838 RepID=A0A0C9RC23_9HYME
MSHVRRWIIRGIIKQNLNGNCKFLEKSGTISFPPDIQEIVSKILKTKTTNQLRKKLWERNFHLVFVISSLKMAIIFEREMKDDESYWRYHHNMTHNLFER